ncbi:glycosyltransferase [Halobacterium salinarum]|nr:glycosyltransferase [Halobacterium salinarum]MDL0118730.1 glycosyltransferase [Halobacterium salinarum]MDL0118758.1 glycosyltransferase [Halobacterium salinarum]
MLITKARDSPYQLTYSIMAMKLPIPLWFLTALILASCAYPRQYYSIKDKSILLAETKFCYRRSEIPISSSNLMRPSPVGKDYSRYFDCIQMMATPEYSICATHYNNKDFLDDSVKAIAQLIRDRPEWEMVITDAGSTDGSLKILNEIAENQKNVHLIVEDGLNIGAGRQLALENANGDILVQITDLDAEYYQDKRILQVASYYKNLCEKYGQVGLSVSGGIICTKEIAEGVGGWHSLPAAEERDFQKRILNIYDLMFLDVKLVKFNAGNTKGLLNKGERTVAVYSALLQGGLSYWCILYNRLFESEDLKTKVFSPFLLTYAYISTIQSISKYSTYTQFDDYVGGIVSTAIHKKPDRWVEAPDEIKPYVDDDGPSLKPPNSQI